MLWAWRRHAGVGAGRGERHHEIACTERELAATLVDRIQPPYAGGEGSAAAVIGEVEQGVDLSRMMQDLPAVEDLLEAADDAPIIRMLNALLTQAARTARATSTSSPYERSSSVRFRVDGTLREVVQPNKALHAAHQPAEDHGRARHRREAAAAGRRISLRIGKRAIDAACPPAPCSHGERAVLRLLDQNRIEVHARRAGHER